MSPSSFRLSHRSLLILTAAVQFCNIAAMDHDEEDPIFARLEAMQRGSRDFESPPVPHHYRVDAAYSTHERAFGRDLRDTRGAYDNGYGPPEEGYIENSPQVLDSFGA